jgi:3-oxoacyl-[acyl-carrier-protein] synthase III
MMPRPAPVNGVMTPDHDDVGIRSFACVLGDTECKPENIPDFGDLWEAAAPCTDFTDMGCATYRKMSGPVQTYVVDAVRRTLQQAGVAPEEIDHIVFATSDLTLSRLPDGFAIRVLEAAGLTGCVPHLLSFQRCCSSLTALQHGRQLFSDPDVSHVVVVALDFTPDDRDRVRPYAIFGDATASCLLTGREPGLVRLVSSAIGMDQDGLRGHDSFASRKKAADRALASVLRASGRQRAQITKVFPTNLHQPLVLFNATAMGIGPDKVHFTDTLRAYGHCGNCDWLINLADYHDRFGIRPGQIYLAQSLAQGFCGLGLLEGSPRPESSGGGR